MAKGVPWGIEVLCQVICTISFDDITLLYERTAFYRVSQCSVNISVSADQWHCVRIGRKTTSPVWVFSRQLLLPGGLFSRFILRMMNNWARRNWKTASGGPVQNLDLWQRLHSLMKQYGNLVNVSWVKGHQNNNSFLAQGNARADELANQGVYGNGVHLQRPMVNTPIDPQEGDKPMAHLSDEHLIYQALSMWINYIETGSVNMSANDARRCGCAAEVKGLDNDQRRFIERLRGLQDVALSTSRRMTP